MVSKVRLMREEAWMGDLLGSKGLVLLVEKLDF